MMGAYSPFTVVVAAKHRHTESNQQHCCNAENSVSCIHETEFLDNIMHVTFSFQATKELYEVGDNRYFGIMKMSLPPETYRLWAR